MGRGRAPCCAKVGLNRGSWTPQEDMRLIAYIQKHGHANWRALPKQAGLLRCGKSCRLRWINYLRPDLKRGNFTAEEEETIIKLHGLLGNKWSKIAACLPGRTDNEIKNVWNTHLKKKVAQREKQKAGAARNDGAASGDAGTPRTSSSASSSTTTNNSSGGSDAGEQCGTSKETEMIDTSPFELEDIDISLMTCIGGEEELLELPVIDIEPEIWSIIDADSADVPDARHGDATVPCTGNAVSTSEAEEANDWWLENLEKELGLWGPTDDTQIQSDDLLGQMGFSGPLGLTDGDPVSTYFQTGPTNAELLEIEPSAVLL
uniref:Uncharacterized protein n=1 Tax=Arundo donax TaxID=35708 RepID=A0A0A9HFK4_ARUDO